MIKFPYHTLDDAILDSSLHRYVQFRLSYFLGFNFLLLLIDGFEFWLMHEQIPVGIMGSIIILRMAAGLIGRGWWGALEILREGVRSKISFNNRHGASVLITNWLALSILAATICNFIVGWIVNSIAIDLSDTTQKLLFYFYVGSFCLQVYLEFFIGSYHSGAYAIWRIYRPFSSFIFIALFNLAVLLILWSTLGVIGLPIAFSLGLLANAAGRFIYVSQTYKKLGLSLLHWPGIAKLKSFILDIPCNLFLWAALAGASLHLEFFPLAVILSQSYITSKMMIFLFLQRQLFRCLVQWSTLFYYDLKKVRQEYYPIFYTRFAANMGKISFYVTFICYTVGVGITYLFFSDNFFVPATLLAIFFLPCSYLSFVQIDAFCHNRFTDLTVSSSMALAALYAILDLGEGHLIIQGASILLILGLLIIYLRKPRLRPQNAIESIKKKSYYTLNWLSARFNVPHDMRLLTLYPQYGCEAVDKLMNDCSELMHPDGLIIPLNAQQILLFEPTSHCCLSHDKIQQVSAGTIATHKVAQKLSWDDCVNQIKQILFAKIEENPFLQVLQGVDHQLEAIDASFREHFAKGVIVDIGREEGLLTSLPSPAHSAIVYRSAKAFFTHFPAHVGDSKRYMTAFLISGKHLKLYVIPSSRADNSLFKKWQIYLHYINWNKI